MHNSTIGMDWLTPKRRGRRPCCTNAAEAARCNHENKEITIMPFFCHPSTIFFLQNFPPDCSFNCKTMYFLSYIIALFTAGCTIIQMIFSGINSFSLHFSDPLTCSTPQSKVLVFFKSWLLVILRFRILQCLPSGTHNYIHFLLSL